MEKRIDHYYRMSTKKKHQHWSAAWFLSEAMMGCALWATRMRHFNISYILLLSMTAPFTAGSYCSYKQFESNRLRLWKMSTWIYKLLLLEVMSDFIWSDCCSQTRNFTFSLMFSIIFAFNKYWKCLLSGMRCCIMGISIIIRTPLGPIDYRIINAYAILPISFVMVLTITIKMRLSVMHPL